MQTLIDKNDALKKEIKALEGRIKDLQNAPIVRQVKKKKQRKKSMFGTLLKNTTQALNLNLFVSAFISSAVFTIWNFRMTGSRRCHRSRLKL